MTFEERWAGAKAGGGDNDPPEPGVYEAALVDARAFTSQAGEDWVALTWRDTAGGYEWDVLYGFRSERQTNVTKGQIHALGVLVDEVGTLEELDQELKAKCGSYYTLSVKQKGERRNTYVDGGVVSDVPADVREAAAAAKADEIPF